LIWANVKPYLLITPPRKPVNLRIDSLPTYLKRSMDDIWFQLTIPEQLHDAMEQGSHQSSAVNGRLKKPDFT